MKNTTLFTATLMTATLSAVAVAHADDANTTVVSATNTVVVVTPNQPVVVGGTAAAPAVNGPSTVAPVGGPGVAPITNPDISQINGQLVPVGTHNEYHYSFRKTLIAANPIGWLMGVYGVSVSHALTTNIAVRGDVTAFINPFGEDGNNALEFGISAPIYLRRTYQGPFIEPGLAVRTYTADTCGDYYSSAPPACTTTTESQTGPQVLVGYHVSYDSGFSMAVAFGIQRNLTTTSEYDDGILPAGYFRVGYAF